jgi:hypothetical protein
MPGTERSRWKASASCRFASRTNRQLEVGDERVVLIDEGDIDLDALAHAWIREVLDDAHAIAGIRQAFLERRQVVLRARVLDVREQLAALAHQEEPPPHERHCRGGAW